MTSTGKGGGAPQSPAQIPMSAAVFYHVALGAVLRMAAQILRTHLSGSGIVLMLLLGAICGPEGNRRPRGQRGTRIGYEASSSAPLLGRRPGALPWSPNKFVLVLLRKGRAYVATGAQVRGQGDRLLCLAGAESTAGVAPPSSLQACAAERSLGTPETGIENDSVL